jgi:superfamily II DNA or RNA helicase
MYEIAYPAALRYRGPAYDKYIAATAVIYRIRDIDKIRYRDNVTKTYSHNLFEQSILRNKTIMKNYMELINATLKGSYLLNYKKGQKCIIFCSSIDMCTTVTSFLKNIYKNHDVRRYVEQDLFENLIDADIIVSTLMSAGTAVDIDNLTTVILTVAISSSQSNIQGMGRLRKLKDDTTPMFLYFVCEDIPKHLEYHEKKRSILESRALTYKSVHIGNPI